MNNSECVPLVKECRVVEILRPGKRRAQDENIIECIDPILSKLCRVDIFYLLDFSGYY
jgi:hypothetical protein